MMESEMMPGFERLYLLEFMVHKVRYDCAASMDENFLNTLGATCVSFTSDSFPPLEMSEDELGSTPPYNSLKVKFKSGKSCLFALKRGSEFLVSDKAQITISRRLPPGGCSPNYTFGTAYLKLSPEFLSVLAISSSSKCLKVSLDILNCQMEIRGTIDIFLRLSCFGTTIMTQFQSDTSSEKESFTFRGGSILPYNATNRSFTSGMMRPQSGFQSMCLAPNMSEKAKDELIIDLLRVIKSSTMLNYLLTNQSLPTGDQIPSGISPTNFDNVIEYNKQRYGTNYVRAFDNPSLFRLPNNNQNRAQIYNNVLLPSPASLEGQKNILNPFISQGNMPSYRPVQNPHILNKIMTYEGKGTISAISENILCKPETRLKKTNPSKIKVLLANASSSRNSINKSIWYSAGAGTSNAFFT